MVPYHYYNTTEDIVSAIHNKSIPQRPDDPHLTDRRWEFIKRCWSPFESRPSMTVVLDFCARELCGAMDVMDPGLTLPASIWSVPSGRQLATRVSSRSLAPVSGQPSVSLPPSKLPATWLSGTPSLVDSASPTSGSFSTTGPRADTDPHGELAQETDASPRVNPPAGQPAVPLKSSSMATLGVSATKRHDQYFLRDGNVCFLVRSPYQVRRLANSVPVHIQGRKYHFSSAQTLFRTRICVLP